MPDEPTHTPARLRRPGRPAGGSAEVREALLAQARELFLQQGFGAVSTRRIAAAAGTTPAMIHYHFGDKRGLFIAMMETAAQPVLAAVERMSDAGSGPPDLEALIRAYMQMVAANPWFPALVLREVLAQDGPMRTQFIERFATRAAPGLVAVLHREREQGWLRDDVDARFAAVSLLGLCVFPFISLPVTGPVLGFRPVGAELDRFIEHTARMFRRGIATPEVSVDA
jgi:TetR/AcrR family transcriptional regulator